MTLPTYTSKTALVGSLGDLTLQPPGNVAQPTNRLLLVVHESANQFPGVGQPTDGNGLQTWTSINSNSTGTAGAAGGLGIVVYWKWGSNNTALHDTFVCSDVGDHQSGSMISIDGADLASPIHLSGTNVQASATTSFSATGITTTVPDCLIVVCTAFDLDSATAGILAGPPSNASLASLTKREDATTNVGTGGGVAIITGTKAAAGATGTTTATVTSTKMAHVVVAIKGVASDVTAALTGLSLTAARGSVAVTREKALGGLSATLVAGSLGSALSVAAGGQAVAIGQGSAVVTIAAPLSGHGITVARGNLAVADSPDVTLQLAGLELAAGAGSIAPAVTVSVSGQAIGATSGLLVSGFSVALVSQSASVARGVMTAASARALSGQSVGVARGSLAAVTALALGGLAAAVARGSLGPATSKALSGQALAAARGSLSVTATRALTGQAVAVAGGVVTAVNSDITIQLTGLTLGVSLGSLVATFPSPPVGTMTFNPRRVREGLMLRPPSRRTWRGSRR